MRIRRRALIEEALLVSRALAAQAVAVLALHGLPDAGQRPEVQVGAAAVGRSGSTTSGSSRAGRTPRACWNSEVLPLDRHVQPPQADVVRPALDQHRREFLRHHRAEERDVLAAATAPGARSCASRRRPSSSGRPRPGSPGPGRRSSCPRPCPPRRSGGRAARWRGRPPRPSRAARSRCS